MMFHRTRIKHNTNFKIIINNDIVDYKNNTKFLVVIIDNKLNWAMRNMYFTFIYPYLIYCIEVWGNAHQTHLDPLIKIHKKVSEQ